MRLLLLISCLVFSNYCEAQKLFVVDAKKAYANNEKVESGDSLSLTDNIQIKNKGGIRLKGESSKMLSLASGLHNLKEAYKNHLLHNERHDSLYNYLELMRIADCSEFEYELTHYSKLNAVFEKGHIIIKQDSTVLRKYGSEYFTSIDPKKDRIIEINWDNPDKDYQGKYHVLVMDIFGDYWSVMVTNKTFLKLDLKNLEFTRYELPLFIKIVSDDCRESYKKAIQFE